MPQEGFDLKNDFGDEHHPTRTLWENALVLATANNWNAEMKARFMTSTRVSGDEADALADALERALDKVPDSGSIPMVTLEKNYDQQSLDEARKFGGESLYQKMLRDMKAGHKLQVRIPDPSADPHTFFAGEGKKTLHEYIAFLRKGAFTIKPSF